MVIVVVGVGIGGGVVVVAVPPGVMLLIYVYLAVSTFFLFEFTLLEDSRTEEGRLDRELTTILIFSSTSVRLYEISDVCTE